MRKKKSKEIVKINNDSRTVDPGLVDEVITGLVKFRKGDNQVKFFLYWLFGLPIETCANLSGYKKSYGYKLIQKYKKQPKLRYTVDRILDAFPERYKAVCKFRLPEISEIEAEALQEYKDNPKLAIEKPQLLKHIKQGAGAMGGDESIPRDTININAARNVMIQINEEMNKKSIDNNVMEAEIEE